MLLDVCFMDSLHVWQQIISRVEQFARLAALRANQTDLLPADHQKRRSLTAASRSRVTREASAGDGSERLQECY